MDENLSCLGRQMQNHSFVVQASDKDLMFVSLVIQAAG